MLDGSSADFTQGSLLNAVSATIVAGQDTLLRFPGDFDPLTDLGDLITDGVVHVAGEELVIPAGQTIHVGGLVEGDMTNAGELCPGYSPGILEVDGNFVQAAGGLLAIELAGTDNLDPLDPQFDQILISGSAALGGELEITELYTPGATHTWTILTAVGGITGSFDTITPGYRASLASGDTELVLSLTRGLLPGDANGDGCVDDLDLTALAVHWQQATNLWEHGDFNGDGIVNDLDFMALAVNWQQGCGGGGSFADAWAATRASVPEPVTLLLLVAGGLAVLRRRSRRDA